MLFGERVAVYCENHMELMSTLCGQYSSNFLNGAYGYHWAWIGCHVHLRNSSPSIVSQKFLVLSLRSKPRLGAHSSGGYTSYCLRRPDLGTRQQSETQFPSVRRRTLLRTFVCQGRGGSAALSKLNFLTACVSATYRRHVCPISLGFKT
jgi:hypothetical protein